MPALRLWIFAVRATRPLAYLMRCLLSFTLYDAAMMDDDIRFSFVYIYDAMRGSQPGQMDIFR